MIKNKQGQQDNKRYKEINKAGNDRAGGNYKPGKIYFSNESLITNETVAAFC